MTALPVAAYDEHADRAIEIDVMSNAKPSPRAGALVAVDLVAKSATVYEVLKESAVELGRVRAGSSLHDHVAPCPSVVLTEVPVGPGR